MPVTIKARGDCGGDHGLAQGHRLAVVSVAIVFEPIFVAFAAALVAHHFEMTILGRLDAVGRVAIRADRTALVALGEELAVDALLVNLFDADMTFAARLRNVSVIDGCVSIHTAFDVVNAVTIVAGRRDDEPHLE